MLHFAWLTTWMLLCNAMFSAGQLKCFHAGGIEPDDCHQAMLRIFLPLIDTYEMERPFNPPGVSFRCHDCGISMKIHRGEVKFSPKSLASQMSLLFNGCTLRYKASGKLTLVESAVTLSMYNYTTVATARGIHVRDSCLAPDKPPAAKRRRIFRL
jgi:hypothetical protein